MKTLSAKTKLRMDFYIFILKRGCKPFLLVLSVSMGLCDEPMGKIREQSDTEYKVLMKSSGRPGLEPVTFCTTKSPGSDAVTNSATRSLSTFTSVSRWRPFQTVFSCAGKTVGPRGADLKILLGAHGGSGGSPPQEKKGVGGPPPKFFEKLGCCNYIFRLSFVFYGNVVNINK